MRARLSFAAVWAAALVVACDEPIVEIDLERMIDQRRPDPYEATTLFPDGRVLREPPPGAVPYRTSPVEPLLEHGLEAGVHAARVPLPVTRALLSRGRNRYDVFCAPCHGVLGDGQTQVAENMTLRKPPSLLEDRIRTMAPGRVYQTVREGYGLMRSYEAELSVEDRWAVVAYLDALELSQSVTLDALPPAVRARVDEELR